MIKFLLYLWQLPQNIVALIWWGLLTIAYKGEFESYDYNGVKYIWFPKWICGVSLGNYVILGGYYGEDIVVVKHEYGHTRQSVYLGPLYLLLIGLPSGLWNLIDRLLMRLFPEYIQKSRKIYYNMPWEKWADILGGVTRHFD